MTPTRREYRHTLAEPAPDTPGMVHLRSITHPLNTMDIEVYCFGRAGAPMGMRWAVAISDSDVDVAVLPGCAAVLIRTTTEA